MKGFNVFTKLLTFLFDFRLFTILAIGFIAFTIIGTVSHEWGHYVVARCLGYEAGINYKSTYFFLNDTTNEAFIKSHWQLYQKQIKAKQKFPDQGKVGSSYVKTATRQFLDYTWRSLSNNANRNYRVNSPVFLQKAIFSTDKLSFLLWVLIFITLFWLRQAANFFVGVTNLLLHGSIRSHSDEFILAGYLNFPRWSISIITASIALIVLVLVIFKFIPLKQRFTFILAGLVGGVSGYLLWLTFFGKFIMP